MKWGWGGEGGDGGWVGGGVWVDYHWKKVEVTIYTMHNKFSNFLCFASFNVLIFVQCRSILIAMTRTGS